MSEAEKSDLVEPEPQGRWRTFLPIAGTIWVVLMLAIPLRYYVGGDRYDERFAWRMFSAVRVQRCQVRVSEEREGIERNIALMEVLPAPWTALLERNRASVIERFLRWRCEEREGTTRVRFRNDCLDANGTALSPTIRLIECASGDITKIEEGAE